MTKPTNGVHKVCKGINLDSDIVEAIDKERGLIPRSTYLNDVLRYALIETGNEPDISENDVAKLGYLSGCKRNKQE
jgi:hypothetical protein